MDRDRRQRFVDLHREGCFLLPNAWDVGSARVLETVGAAAIATTSAGVAFSLGRPDHGFHTEHDDRVDRDTMLRRVGDIAAGVGVPVSADLEDGYGEAPEAVVTAIEGALAVGAAGANIEDFTGVRGRPLYEPVLAVERIAAARAAIDASGEPFVLVGRTDALLAELPLAEAITRANAYLAAGADCAFVPGAGDAETIGTLVRDIDGPVNVVMGLTGGQLTFDDLAEMGVRRVSVGGSLVRTLYRHLLDAARELVESGTFRYADAQLPHADLNRLFTRP